MNYNNINSVDELRAKFNLPIITESTGDGKADENI